MSVEALSWVFAHSESKGTARNVLFAIANHVAADTGEGWCYVATILHDANCSYEPYRRAVKDLIERGELGRDVNEGTGGRFTRGDSKPNLWTMPLFLASRPPQIGGAVIHRPRQSARPAAPPVRAGRTVTEEPSTTTTLVELTLDDAPAIDQVSIVWEAWQTSTGHHRAVLDSKRRKRIERALKLFSLEDVTAAVQGWEYSPWHRGENPSNTIYDGIELLLRDAGQIEKMRDAYLDALADSASARHEAQAAPVSSEPCSTCEGKTWVYDEATGNARPCPSCRAGIIP